jgi:hypothetical protein
LDPDPYLIRIRIGIQPKMLDPDPDEINADPQPCLFWWRIFTYGGIFFRGFFCMSSRHLIGRTFPLLLLIGWFLPLGLKWAQECIAALSVWYHVVAWSLPLLKMTAALLLSVVGKFPT